MAAPVKVFISYAREDTAFVDRLAEALGTRGILSWVDRREIPPAADWLRRIVDGIVNATFFVFVVSPDSVSSEVCAVELQQAAGLNKPVVPLLLRIAETPKALKSLQWADFSGVESFDDCVTKLEATLRRDPDWLAEHAQLAVSAADWDSRGRRWYSLLHGADIKKAENWLAQANETRPLPTALQREYLHASRRFSTRWKVVASSTTIALLIISAATIVSRQRSVREAQARDLAARAVQLRNSDQSALAPSTLMLVEAVRQLAELGVRSPDIDAMLRSGIGMLLRPLGAGTHPYGTGGMAVASNGKHIATFAVGLSGNVAANWSDKTDNTVLIWNVPSDTPVSALVHDGPVTAAAFVGNDLIVTGTFAGSISFWDLNQVRSGRPSPLASHAQGGIITSIASSASHAIAVTANSSGKVCAWNATTGDPLWERSASSGDGIVLVDISLDGNLAASGNKDGEVKVWTLKDGKPLRSMKHTSGGSITALVFSPGSNQLASGDDKGEMHLWSPTTDSDRFAFSHRGGVREIAYSSTETRSSFIATVSDDGSLRVLDALAFGPWRITEFRFDYALWRLALDPNGHLAAVARGDGFVDLFDRKQARVVGRLQIPGGNIATGLAFLPNNVLAVVDGGQGVQFAEVTAGRESDVLNTSERVTQLTLSVSGLLVASDSSKAYIVDLSKTPAEPNALHVPSFTQIAMHPAGGRAALVDEAAKMLRIVALPDGREITSWPIADNIGAVAWHPTHEIVAVAKRDGGVWLYDSDSGRNLAHTATGGNSLSFSRSGVLIAIVVPYEGLRIWDWARGTEPWMPVGTGDVAAAVISPDELLLMASKDRLVRVTSMPPSDQGDRPPRQVWAAEFCGRDKKLTLSADGTLMAIACEDGRIRVWSARTGTIASDLFYPGKPDALAFDGDSRILVVGGSIGLRGFLISGDDIVTEACRRLQRNFRQAEWLRYVGTGKCRPICTQRPGCE